MRAVVLGTWGRPMAIEQQARWLSADVEVVRWPNLDSWDVATGRPRTPDTVRPGKPKTLEAVRAIDSIGADLVITSFIDDAIQGSLSSVYRGKKLFCVSKDAARLEDNRTYARDVCWNYGVAASAMIRLEHEEKFAGLVRGGRVIPRTHYEWVIKPGGAKSDNAKFSYPVFCPTVEAVNKALKKRPMSEYPVVVEQKLFGIDIAFSAFVDFTRTDPIVPMTTEFEYPWSESQAVGMGTPELGVHDVVGIAERPMKEILNRLVPWFRKVGYVGWFDVSCMYDWKEDRLVVYEFMTRLGVAQLETILAMLNVPFVKLVQWLLDGTLDPAQIRWRAKHGVGTVICGPVGKRLEVAGPVVSHHDDGNWLVADSESRSTTHFRQDVICIEGGDMIATGDSGKVCCAVGTGNSFTAARDAAYEQVGFLRARDGTQLSVIEDVGYRWTQEMVDRLARAGLLPNGTPY